MNGKFSLSEQSQGEESLAITVRSQGISRRIAGNLLKLEQERKEENVQPLERLNTWQVQQPRQSIQVEIMIDQAKIRH